ncbi:hypothetical protein VIGAN_10051000 [Vigna angularis var. angularis]|uniref:X8 domain-containing protein n=1 Tax=Vigna angularis var. angularis TaxID=157739 RepID=A0A0S3T265_PHAAN|nr:hypothetical protein VIGAN_10051000 [Vigna angularis var. angularis]
MRIAPGYPKLAKDTLMDEGHWSLAQHLGRHMEWRGDSIDLLDRVSHPWRARRCLGAIDYASGAGADCSPILQNGACYQPNTVKDHCNYAVNSYFQRKGQAQGSCDLLVLPPQAKIHLLQHPHVFTPQALEHEENPSCPFLSMLKLPFISIKLPTLVPLDGFG